MTSRLHERVFLISVCFAALPLVKFGHYELQPSKVYCFARGGRGVALDDAYLVVSCAEHYIKLVLQSALFSMVLFLEYKSCLSGIFDL